MKSFINSLKIRKEERLPVTIFFIFQLILNGLLIAYYAQLFTNPVKDYFKLFVRNFQVSGYDPLTYIVVSDWNPVYEVNRHPLLAFFYYPAYLLNHILIETTGINCVQFIVAFGTIFATVYGFILMLRISKEILNLTTIDSTILAFLLYSFAHVLIAAITPDHFILSLFALLLTVYITGKCFIKRKKLNKTNTILLFLLVAGISLNNGLKVIFANLFANGKRFFAIKNILLAIIIPAAAVWMIGEWQFNTYSVKRYKERKAKQHKYVEWEKAQKFKTFVDTTTIKDNKLQKQFFEYQWEKYRKEVREKLHKKPAFAHTGTPISKTRFLNWTDVTTPRLQTITENMFGESIQLHQKYALKDVLTSRPVFVSYDNIFNYIIEAVIIILFLIGIIYGRHEKLLHLVLSFAALDFLLHIVLGFGINEVYIMTCHWIYIIPISIAYLLRSVNAKMRIALRLLLILIVAFLYVYNSTIFINYLYS